MDNSTCSEGCPDKIVIGEHKHDGKNYGRIGSEGIKYDAGKNRLELIPTKALEEVGWVFTYGATKYDDFNYRKGMDWSRIYGATLRHLTAWHSDQDVDVETKRSHLAHAACCILMLLDCEIHGFGEDNRPDRVG